MPAKKMLKPKSDLDKIVVEWQDRLRLQDWDITIHSGKLADIGHIGATAPHLNDQTAVILIADPEHIGEGTGTCTDVEVTVVHELLHIKSDMALCRLSEFSQGKVPAWECFIEHVAQALVAAKRGKVRIRA